MARLRWNFVATPWWQQPSSLLCFIALMGCIHALWWRDSLLQTRSHLIEQKRQAHRPTGGRERHAATALLLPALEPVFEEMRYPWNEILDSLQRATSASVVLLELQPEDGDVRRIHIRGVTGDAKDVFDLLSALQNDPSWSSVRLVSQTRTDNLATPQDSNSAVPPLPPAQSRSIAFSLTAEWKRS